MFAMETPLENKRFLKKRAQKPRAFLSSNKAGDMHSSQVLTGTEETAHPKTRSPQKT